MIRKLLRNIKKGKENIVKVRTAIDNLDNEKFGRWVKVCAIQALDIADQALDVRQKAVNLVQAIREDVRTHIRDTQADAPASDKQPRRRFDWVPVIVANDTTQPNNRKD